MNRQEAAQKAERALGRGWRFVERPARELTQHQQRICAAFTARAFARNLHSLYVLAHTDSGVWSIPPHAHQGTPQFLGTSYSTTAASVRQWADDHGEEPYPEPEGPE